MGNSASVPLTLRAVKLWLEPEETTKLKVLIIDANNFDHRRIATLDLDDHIGVSGGKFDVTKTGFSKSTKNVYIENFVLHGEVTGSASACTLNLNLFIGVSGNELVFVPPSTNIGNSACAFVLEYGHLYTALSLSKDGSLQTSTVDLDEKLGNKNGEFEPGSSKFHYSALDVHLDETGLILHARLRNYEKGFVDAFIDLSTIYANKGGELVYEAPGDEPFDRDGIITQFTETVPYFGYLAVAGHLAKANTDHAKRALARTLYSTIVFATATTGAIMGGPIGLAIGATAGTLLGMAAEGIIRTTITDGKVYADLDEITFKRFVKEALINSVSGLASGTLGKHAGKWAMGKASQTMVDAVKQKVQARLVEEGVDKVGGQIITTSSTYAVSAIEEYVNQLHEVMREEEVQGEKVQEEGA